MRVDLPWPPTVNTYWTFMPTGRGRMTVIIAPPGHAFRTAAFCRVRRLKLARMLGPVRVTIEASRPDRRMRDLDNLHKATLDALVFAGAIEGDHLVHDLRIVDTYRIVRDGRISIDIEALPEREYEDAR